MKTIKLLTVCAALLLARSSPAEGLTVLSIDWWHCPQGTNGLDDHGFGTNRVCWPYWFLAQGSTNGVDWENLAVNPWTNGNYDGGTWPFLTQVDTVDTNTDYIPLKYEFLYLSIQYPDICNTHPESQWLAGHIVNDSARHIHTPGAYESVLTTAFNMDGGSSGEYFVFQRAQHVGTNSDTLGVPVGVTFEYYTLVESKGNPTGSFFHPDAAFGVSVDTNNLALVVNHIPYTGHSVEGYLDMITMDKVSGATLTTDRSGYSILYSTDWDTPDLATNLPASIDISGANSSFYFLP